MGYFLLLFVRRLNLKNGKPTSKVVSVSSIFNSSSSEMIKSENNSPTLAIKAFCFGESVGKVCREKIERLNSLSLANVSIIASVVSVACGLLRIVANMYKPRSVNAVGNLTLPPFIEVENFDFNGSHSGSVSSIKYPSGNLFISYF